jgi:hypothetical protein
MSGRLLQGQRTARLRSPGRKNRSIQTLHTEIYNLRKFTKKLFFPKVSFKTRIYNQLIKQSNSIAKICKDINES